MGFGFHIPKHSGTQFKHRKAFDKTGKFYSKKAKSNSLKLEGSNRSKNKMDEFEKFDKSNLKKVLKISTFIIALSVLGCLIYIIGRGTSGMLSFLKANKIEMTELRKNKEAKELAIA